jgi:hypothetical protein
MTVLAKVERPCAIRQIITTGNHFDGSKPAAGPTFANDIFKFAAAAAGGLFDPTDSVYYAFERADALVLLGIELQMAGQNTWKVELKDVDDVLVTIASGTTETSYVRGSDDPPVLLWGTRIVVTTTGGAPTGLQATIKLAPYRTYPG